MMLLKEDHISGKIKLIFRERSKKEEVKTVEV